MGEDEEEHMEGEKEEGEKEEGAEMHGEHKEHGMHGEHKGHGMHGGMHEEQKAKPAKEARKPFPEHAKGKAKGRGK